MILDEATAHELVERYIPLAKKLAFDYKKKLPRRFDVDELISAAYLGLVEAADRYDPSFGFAFTTFAYPRIEGAIKDHLRQFKTMSSLEDFELEADAEIQGDFSESLQIVAKGLGEQAKDMLRCYYEDQVSMKEIGERYGLTEGRVSQLFNNYRTQIRDRWNERDLQTALAA
jgi:RNA polymerase sigma factor (sigma-70 family)